MKIDEKKINEILKNEQKAKDIKTTWNQLYDQVIQYTMPFKSYSFDSAQPGNLEKKDEQLFNSVGQNAATAFVNKIQSILTPVDTDFIGLECGYFYKDDTTAKQETNLELEKICDILNNLKAVSNFDIAISEFYYDLVFGTACLLTFGGTPDRPLSFKAVSFKDYSILEGNDGSVNKVFRNFNIPIEEINSYWKNIDKKQIEDLEQGKKGTDLLELLECVYYDYDTNKWVYCVIERSKKIALVIKEYKNNPFIILRWNKGANEYYGRGVGILALNDLKTYNRIMRDSMRMLSFSLPLIVASESDVFNDRLELSPDYVNYVKYENGKPLVDQLRFDNRFDITQYNIESIKMDINKTMLSGSLPNEQAGRTATEIQERIAEQNVNYVSVFGRLIQEFLFTLPKIMIEILQNNFDYFKEVDIDKFNGFHIKIRVKTPLARINKQQKINDIMQAINLLGSLSPEYVSRFLKIDQMMLDLIHECGVSEDLVYTLEEILYKDEEKARAQAQMEQAQVQQNIDVQGIMEGQKAMAEQKAKMKLGF
jgi:hypothetical protein